MSSRNSLLSLLLAGTLWAQGPEVPLDPRSAFKVNLPADSPVALITTDFGPSRATTRGGALQVDLRSTLLLRNLGNRRVRGISFLVLAQEVTPGGKGSVTVPSLDIEPGDSFPIRIDLRLMRPVAAAGGSLVEIALDGVIFEDMNFYGPNRVNSRRALVGWELAARRDRKQLLGRLEAGGPDALQRELTQTLARMSDQPRLEIQSARSGRTTTAAGAERQVEFAFLNLPEAPIELLGGFVRVAGNEARLPKLDLKNRSAKAVRWVEVGWRPKDESGRELEAGVLPLEVELAPGQAAQYLKDAALRYSRPGGAPIDIQGFTAFVTGVEFRDGAQWVPSSPARDTVGPEAQRLAELYRRRGVEAVIAQLKRLR